MTIEPGNVVNGRFVTHEAPGPDTLWWWHVDDDDAVYSGSEATQDDAWREAMAAVGRVVGVRAQAARAEGEAAGYQRAIDEACALLGAQHDEIAGRGTEWAYDDGMLYALDVAEQAVRALAPVEPVSKADELPGGAR